MNESIGKYSVAEILATFCDSILKKAASNMRDEEVEDQLTKAVELFENINDKDLFIDLYRNQLARRLLDEKSANEDSERSMIAKIKLCCGSQFTSRVEGMITDVDLSQTV